MELEKIRGILSEILDTDPAAITENSFLVDDLGADSLDLFQLLIRLEQEYDIETDEHLRDRIFTVGDVIDAIRGLKNAG